MGHGSCLHIGGADRKAQSINYQNKAGHLPLFPKLRPAKKKVPRVEPRHCRALPEEGSQAQSPTHSPTGSHRQVTFLDSESTSEEGQAAGQPSTGLDLGPSPKLGLDIKHFLQESAAMQKRVGRVISYKSPWQKTIKSGSSGGDAGSTHLTGGGC